MSATPLGRLCINALRAPARDAVQAAGSGHRGSPVALAPEGAREHFAARLGAGGRLPCERLGADGAFYAPWNAQE